MLYNIMYIILTVGAGWPLEAGGGGCCHDVLCGREGGLSPAAAVG
jgi:hypothetical protein